jgi:phosphoribosylformimino-5-aminoimidazole carboxamide ribonucleotide (ProFAR) isomerase
MTLEVIPAIDVAGGRLARFSRAAAEPLDAYDGDPVKAARAFVEAGARWIHVVDMDLARTGRPGNLEMVREIAALGVPVQASGGVASGPQADALLSAGATRVVLGSVALGYREATAKLVHLMGDTLVVGIEAEGPRIVPRGRGARELPLWDTLVWLAGLDVKRFLFTEVGRVGELGGPDLDGIWALATHTGRPVIASGGIRGIEDLKAVAALGEPVEAAIVGRALYEGDVDLASAIASVG